MNVQTELPHDVGFLHSLIVEKDARIAEQETVLFEQTQTIEQLQEQVRILLHYRFSSSRSEKNLAVIDHRQLGIFNEAEAAVKGPTSPPRKVAVRSHERIQRGGRKPLPEHLPREDVVIALSEEERRCPHDANHLMKKIGEEVSEKLDIVPAKFKVIRTIREKYACGDCEEGVKMAPIPAQILPKSNAAPGLLAYLVTAKYVDAMPLYRLEKSFQRIGVDLPRITMARWLLGLAEALTPLINLLTEELLASSYLHADETRIQVLKENGRPAQSLSYMWVLARDGPQPIVLYEYHPSRSGEVARRLLEEFHGYLQVDGYDGYNAVCAREDVIRVGCWAHVRRKFVEALKANPKAVLAEETLTRIRELYAIEIELHGKSHDQIRTGRKEKAEPILAELRTLCTETLSKIPPQSLTGKALAYLDHEWLHLIRYLDDGRLSIDNNYIENAIRPFALGRKNWLFADTVAGAQASATLYSLIETAKRNGREPFAYLRFIFQMLPLATNIDDIETLLPWNANTIAAGHA